MVAVVVVLLGRLVDPLSFVAALVVAWIAARAGARLRLTIPLAALAISAGVGMFYCSLQTGCREPFDGQGIVLWLIGAVASAIHLMIAVLIVGWFRRGPGSPR